ncbi:MAG: MaoC family dehydratase [Candidatus Adiutrix sp.]|jgi:3-hydroxybutyryl-CoA dehydratase|nr:MaoC family dehydratase [Candidatus Adiutrix sp.]
MTYDEFQIGQEAAQSLLISAEAVECYAQLVGDTNPVHLDEDYASRSFFRQRVAHGLLVAGPISAILGTRLPGPGTIYLSQSLEFKRPVTLGQTITARVKIAEKFDRHKKLKLRTWVENQAGQLVLDGSATVLVR